MQDKRMCSAQGGVEGLPVAKQEDRWDSTVLDLLLYDEPGALWSLDDLARQCDDRINARDAVVRLKSAGLVHEIQDCVFASRAAQHFHRLRS
jgi:hypothetical protein